MGEFTIQIAGFSAAVTSLFASTKDYCIRYLSQDEPQCRITVTREDLEFEQDLHEERAQAMWTSWERASRHMEEARQRP